MMENTEFAGLSFSLMEFIDTTIPAWIIFLLGALVIAVMTWYYLRKRSGRSASIRYSDLRLVRRAARTGRQRYRFVLFLFRTLAIALLFVAFARPRSGTEYVEVTSEGVDIILAVDVSSSMMAEDFKPHNRLHVAKEEMKKFVHKRLNDRIGLVVFARHSFTQCPLTTDYGVLLNFIDQVDFGMVEDGTAIGMALANSINRLRDSDTESKVIILLTDGDNNAGEIDPLTAANLAATFDIKIYTIGAGKPGNAMYPYQDPVFGKRYVYQPTKIDEQSLKQIAERTDGRYFRARSEAELEQVYAEIDKMEKTEVKTASHIQYQELFGPFTYAALILLALELLLTHTYFRKLP